MRKSIPEEIERLKSSLINAHGSLEYLRGMLKDSKVMYARLDEAHRLLMQVSTVFDYDKQADICPVCHEAAPGGWGHEASQPFHKKDCALALFLGLEVVDG